MGRDHHPLGSVLQASLSVGSLLDGYRIDEQIGWGSVAHVYRATELASGKTVALKILRQRYAADLEVAARLAREATVVSRVENPHVVRITRLGECERGPYFVMEYIEGVALDTILSSGEGLSTPQLLRIALQVCSALGAVHDQGIVHRDLKPENILVIGPLDDALFIKLIDFGVAKASFDEIHVASTRPGTIVGSPSYMAPEQIRSLPVDARTDIYALGVLLYEMISGRRPFEGELLQEVLAGHVMQHPPPLSSTSGQPVDPRLEALVFRCLAKAPDDRPSAMIELANELRAITAEIAPDVLAALAPPEESREPSLAGTDEQTRTPEPLEQTRGPVQTAPESSGVPGRLDEPTSPGEVSRSEVEPERPLSPSPRRRLALYLALSLAAVVIALGLGRLGC